MAHTTTTLMILQTAVYCESKSNIWCCYLFTLTAQPLPAVKKTQELTDILENDNQDVCVTYCTSSDILVTKTLKTVTKFKDWYFYNPRLSHFLASFAFKPF